MDQHLGDLEQKTETPEPGSGLPLKRWLLISVLVAILIGIAILNSKETDHTPIAISFLGFTNQPNYGVRTALFFVEDEHTMRTFYGYLWVEVEGLKDHEVHAIYAYTATPQSSGRGSLWLVEVDAPSEPGRWRVSWIVYRTPFRVRLLQYARDHGLRSPLWLGSLASRLRPNKATACATKSSEWFTNSP